MGSESYRILVFPAWRTKAVSGTKWGEYPMAPALLGGHSPRMKHNKFPQDPIPKLADASRLAAFEKSNQNAADFAPSPDAVARKAYYIYENEGSLPGNEVQHWLAAEAELIAERNLTRVHGFHNRT